ncbi:MAG: helix-turn-helix domain-containing protein [Candidatus Tectomicrobia bacterium]
MGEYLTVDQAATLLHVSSTTVRRWIYQGSLKAKKINTGRNARVLIDKDDVDELLVPMNQYRPSHASTGRHAAVEAILALQRQFAKRGIDVDALIDQNRQERDRAEASD